MFLDLARNYCLCVKIIVEMSFDGSKRRVSFKYLHKIETFHGFSYEKYFHIFSFSKRDIETTFKDACHINNIYNKIHKISQSSRQSFDYYVQN